MELSSFIVALVSAQHVLSISQPLFLALRATDCDIVKAYEDAELCRFCYNVSEASVVLYGQVLAESVNSVLSKPRTAGHSSY